MAPNRTLALAFAISFLTGACSNIPPLDIPSPFTVAHIIDQIQCEVAQVAELPAFRKSNWIVVADLTLQVEESVDLTPRISLLSPLLKENSTFAFGVGGQFKRERQRIYSETIELPVRNAKLSRCNTLKDKFDLTGDLGIVETVGLGLGSFDQEDAVRFPAKDKSAFGQTIQFAITKNVSGVGATWTLIHFIGPGGVFGAERVDTHKLILSFAQVPATAVKTAQGVTRVAPALSGAVERANQLNTKMLLQSLPSFRQSR